MAKVIMEGAQDFRAKAQVQRKVRTKFPVILNEECIVVRAVPVIGQAPAAKTELRRAEQEILEVCVTVGRVGKKEFAVEDLRKVLVEAYARKFAAETEHMSAAHPAYGIHKIEVVLILRLVAEGSWTNFKARAGKHKLVN